jgi:N-acylneuraminate cytidylyltransferase
MWETKQGPIWDQGKYDSLITVKPLKEFVIDENGKPMNFSYGRWHEWSQDLPQWFVMDFPIHIMSKGTYLRHSYFVGSKPYLYVVRSPSIDIDTPEEFQLAQEIYAARHPLKPVVRQVPSKTTDDLP